MIANRIDTRRKGGALALNPNSFDAPRAIFMARLLPLVCGLFVLAPLSLRGALVWSRMEAGSTARGLGEFVDFSFPFVNPGPKPVTILNIEASCGCMKPELAKKKFLAGEHGVLNVRVKANGEGVSTQTVSVLTSAAPRAPTVLKISLEMPFTLEISPQPLVWERGESNEPKEVRVKVGKDIDIKVKSVFCPDPNFRVEYFMDKPGRNYHLRVIPRSTEKPRSGTIDFEFEGLPGAGVDTRPIRVEVK